MAQHWLTEPELLWITPLQLLCQVAIDPFREHPRTRDRSAGLDPRNDSTEEDLLQRIAAADIGALDALYERFGRQAFSLAFRIVGNQQTAEEIVQDAFLSVWRKAATYRSGSGSVRTWFFSIVHHRALDYVRRPANARPPLQLNDEALSIAEPDVFPAVYARVTGEEMRHAMETLPAEQRRALELVYFNGLTFSETATLSGVPVGTIKSRVRLALARLKSELREKVEP